jgi:AcrR family transcriptional regulator
MNKYMKSSKSSKSGYNVATPGRLLDAAEQLFATRHYETVTLREIAEMTQSSVGQIVYHFGQKDALIREVILRRAGVLTEERLQLLDGYEKLVGPQNVAVEPLVRAYIDPYFQRLMGDHSGWRAYAQFIGRNVWDEKISPILSEAYNRSAKRFIAALQQALPVLTEADSLRAFQYLVVTIYGATTSDLRSKSLSNNDDLVDDMQGYVNSLIPFVTGGIERLAKVREAANQEQREL